MSSEKLLIIGQTSLGELGDPLMSELIAARFFGTRRFEVCTNVIEGMAALERIKAAGAPEFKAVVLDMALPMIGDEVEPTPEVLGRYPGLRDRYLTSNGAFSIGIDMARLMGETFPVERNLYTLMPHRLTLTPADAALFASVISISGGELHKHPSNSYIKPEAASGYEPLFGS